MDSEHPQTSHNSTTAGSHVNYDTDIPRKSTSVSFRTNGSAKGSFIFILIWLP